MATNKLLIRTIRKNLISMGLFASLAMGAVLLFFNITQERITASQAHFEEQTLHSLTASMGNIITLHYVPFPMEDSIAYSIQRAQQRLGTILPSFTQEGYSGTIRLLVAIDNNDSIIAMRVTEHKETPGLGDRIEGTKSLWSTQFIGKKLSQTNWDVSTHGGNFDALSGATISSRAVIKAIEYSLTRWQKLKTNE